MGCAITLFYIRTFKNLYSIPKGNLDNIRDEIDRCHENNPFHYILLYRTSNYIEQKCKTWVS